VLSFFKEKTETRGGQALAEYAVMAGILVFCLAAMNKTVTGLLGGALKRIIEMTSLPLP